MRIFDIVAASLGIIVLSPLLLIIGILIKMGSPGSVLFRGVRVGREGQLFRICKYRTMTEKGALAGPGITSSDDARITRIGRLLRKRKLDELPQLWNVLKGEMSLVGPRPEDPRYVALYNAKQREILRQRPGITSPASIIFRNEESLLRSDGMDRYVAYFMPEKIRIDLEYFESHTFWGDIGILLQTAGLLIRRGGAKAARSSNTR